MKTLSKRGALIIFEGLDKSGKTTQCKKLVEELRKEETKCELLRFPDRTTDIGGIISNYLECKTELDDHSVHLLFSSNRWELVPRMKKMLNEGITLIVDRYAFSGVAFSAAKEGMKLDWCQQSDVGLPRPDMVVFLDLNVEESTRRLSFGEERYENATFQQCVYKNYKMLQDNSWKIVDANKSIEGLHSEIMDLVKDAIKAAQHTKLGTLWTSTFNKDEQLIK